MNPTVLSLLATIAAACAAPIAAQSAPSPPDIDASLARWLTSGGEDRELLGAAVAAVLDAGEPGFAKLASAARAAAESADRERRDGVEVLLRDVALGFLARARASDLRFAGQFAPLAPLQPWIGRIYLRLVIEPPEWFPEDQRAQVVPALRDLFPKGPDAAARTALHDIATDAEFEAADLTRALGCAFAQWGDRTLIQPRLDEVAHAAGERASDDELHFVRELALLHYELRDYAAAADAWTEYLRKREGHGARVRPADYYDAACCLGLSGRIPDALAELERCAGLLRSDDVDPSLRLERAMFERDPELRAVRSLQRFGEILDEVFGARPK